MGGARCPDGRNSEASRLLIVFFLLFLSFHCTINYVTFYLFIYFSKCACLVHRSICFLFFFLTFLVYHMTCSFFFSLSKGKKALRTLEKKRLYYYYFFLRLEEPKHDLIISFQRRALNSVWTHKGVLCLRSSFWLRAKTMRNHKGTLFFFLQTRRVVLPTAGVLTAFYESKHYARTRVGSIGVVRTLNEFQASRARLYP